MKEKVFNLKVKFSIIALVNGFICFLVGVYLFGQFAKKQFEKTTDEKASLISTHIIDDMEHAMLAKQSRRLQNTLDIYRSFDEVVDVRIFNSKGEEVYFSFPVKPDSKLEEILKTGKAISYYQKIDDRHVKTYMIPISDISVSEDSQGKNDESRGALVLSLSLEKMRQNISEMNRDYYIMFAFFALSYIVLNTIAFRRYFLRPLFRLHKGAESLSRGDFDHRIPVSSRDEIGTLTEHFNQMGLTLKGLFDEVQGKNKELTKQYMLLARSHKEWQETFDGITDQVCVIDRESNIVRANRAFKKYNLLPENEEINKKCSELINTYLSDGYSHRRVLETRNPVAEEYYDGKRGTILQISIFPYFYPEGHLVGSVFVAKDITEKKEKEIRFIMNERLAYLGKIASGIAHEIRTPLATIAGCAESLLRRINLEQYNPKLFTDYLRMVEEEINRCKVITESMLSLVRLGDGKTGVSVNKILDRTIELIGFQRRLLNIEIHRDYDEGIPLIQINEGELKQVFLTILTNALDAMEDRGTLTLKTGMEQDSVFILIQDTGPGIPPAAKDRIFEPFFTTKADKGGTGLGLSIAEKIIKEKKGKIEVSSVEREGTTFKILLPLF
ncbi:MAG: HAMP domain-containing protein [Candidatus Tectomicrobia bacterium]|uniref:histidine kinase n=1 Tax=Tectimicrobiota bacterium TaxID=2528274 RepID=A0A933GK10_UNCTE|nr:HAMP domain-containing protein [Candidatus Tectomicrobia bacterium]